MRTIISIVVLMVSSFTVVGSASAWGPDEWVRRHHRVVHGKPRSIFVDPVGYAYPEIKYLYAKSGYQPLPDPTPSPALRSAPAPATLPR